MMKMKVYEFKSFIIFPEDALTDDLETEGRQLKYKGIPVYPLYSKGIRELFGGKAAFFAERNILSILPECDIQPIAADTVYEKTNLPKQYIALYCKKCGGFMFVDYTGCTLDKAKEYISKADFGECKAGGYHVEFGKLKDYTLIFEEH